MDQVKSRKAGKDPQAWSAEEERKEMNNTKLTSDA